MTPTAAMMPLSQLMPASTSTWGRLCSESLAMYSMPQRMQKLMPRVGRKRGMEAAQPTCQLGKSLRRPQGAVMMGIWAMAMTMVQKRARVQSGPAMYLPTAATPVARVEATTKGKQCLLKAWNMRGLMRMQKMLKELERRRSLVRPTSQKLPASSRMAKKVETIMSMVTETEVTDKISPHYNHIAFIYIQTCNSREASSTSKSPTRPYSPSTCPPTPNWSACSPSTSTRNTASFQQCDSSIALQGRRQRRERQT